MAVLSGKKPAIMCEHSSHVVAGFFVSKFMADSISKLNTSNDLSGYIEIIMEIFDQVNYADDG